MKREQEDSEVVVPKITQLLIEARQARKPQMRSWLVSLPLLAMVTWFRHELLQQGQTILLALNVFGFAGIALAIYQHEKRRIDFMEKAMLEVLASLNRTGSTRG